MQKIQFTMTETMDLETARRLLHQMVKEVYANHDSITIPLSLSSSHLRSQKD